MTSEEFREEVRRGMLARITDDYSNGNNGHISTALHSKFRKQIMDTTSLTKAIRDFELLDGSLGSNTQPMAYRACYRILTQWGR